MTTPNLATIAEVLEAERVAAVAKAAEIAGRRAQAAEARSTAEQLAAEADRDENEARRTRNDSQFMAAIRALSTEQSDARVAAIQALKSGDEPAFEAWLRYRRVGARVAGRREALQGAYEAATGKQAPPGIGMPPLVRDAYNPLDPEPWNVFLMTHLARAESELKRETLMSSMRELEAAQLAAVQETN